MQKVGNLEEETMQGPLEWYPSSGCLQLKWITPNQNRLQVQSNVPSQRIRLTLRMILVSKWRGDCLTGRQSSGAVSQDWGRAPGTLSGLPRPSKGGRSLTGNWHPFWKVFKFHLKEPNPGRKGVSQTSCRVTSWPRWAQVLQLLLLQQVASLGEYQGARLENSERENSTDFSLLQRLQAGGCLHPPADGGQRGGGKEGEGGGGGGGDSN